MPKLLAENGEMRAKIMRLEEELKVVNWFIEVKEDGIDTK